MPEASISTSPIGGGGFSGSGDTPAALSSSSASSNGRTVDSNNPSGLNDQRGYIVKIFEKYYIISSSGQKSSKSFATRAAAESAMGF